MDASSSTNESLLSLWESVRRQVLANRANGGRCRFIGDNQRAYAELLRAEMDRRKLKYKTIAWLEKMDRRTPMRATDERYAGAPAAESYSAQ